ncbi:hypothetical protein PMZ80_001694 [Knufia obscura]|uniref:C2H2-type domain-containing protein n=1 Tax=Knufia obscura TaxID=1635080 RepID=A0ABR0S3W5_9EURO|nr:hypothetical protein PMZ80_001694 [Knufia obscura]
MASVANKIKCTFENCYQRFSSVEAMRKHKDKAKDDVHDFYCKKCDEDCTDDSSAQPVELSSRAKVDEIVTLSHRQRQKLKCPGCNEMFTDASGLMGHIEHNKCKIIRRDDFHRHRAEQQIEKDAMEELQGGMLHGETVISTGSDSDPTGGASLLENQRIPMSRDWQGAPEDDLWGVGSENYGRQESDMARQMSDLALDKYPALVANSSILPSASTAVTSTRQTENDSDISQSTAATSDLLDMKEVPKTRPAQSIFGNNSAWGANKAARAQRQPIREISPNLLDNASSINLLDSSIMDKESVATRGTRPSHTSYPGNTNTNSIPPAAKAENQDPNAPNAQVQTRPQMRMASRDKLQTYWQPLQQCYVCPGHMCGRKLRSIQEFEQHLLSGAHVGGMVQCPSCLKRFKTTTALVAHAESGSTKCDLRKTEEFDLAIQQITAGLIKVEGSWSGAGNAKFESVPIGQW